MRFEAFVLGGYPRSPRVRKALRDLERGVVDSESVERIVIEDSLALIGVQIGAGLTIVGDPLLDWHDLLRPFAEAWRGVYVDGLLRYFDNNFFYRIPVVRELPDPSKRVLGPRVAKLVQALPPDTRLRVTVPGPITFARLSRIEGPRFEEVAETVARILGEEIRLAVELGAKVVEIDEPWLSSVDATREDAELCRDLVSKYMAGFGETILATYFSPPSPEIAEVLAEIPTQFVAIDYVDSPKRAEKALEKMSGRGVAVGIVQARDLYRDRTDTAIDVVKRLVREVGVSSIAVTTSAWLDLLPLRHAIEKTRVLGEIARAIVKELGLELSSSS